MKQITKLPIKPFTPGSTPESVTNIPSKAYLDGLRTAIHPEPKPHWTDGPITLILMVLGIVMPFVLSMIFGGGR